MHIIFEVLGGGGELTLCIAAWRKAWFFKPGVPFCAGDKESLNSFVYFKWTITYHITNPKGKRPECHDTGRITSKKVFRFFILKSMYA